MRYYTSEIAARAELHNVSMVTRLKGYNGVFKNNRGEIWDFKRVAAQMFMQRLQTYKLKIINYKYLHIWQIIIISLIVSSWRFNNAEPCAT